MVTCLYGFGSVIWQMVKTGLSQKPWLAGAWNRNGLFLLCDNLIDSSLAELPSRSLFYLHGCFCNTGIHQQLLAQSLDIWRCVSSLFLLRSPHISMWPNLSGHKNKRGRSLLSSSLWSTGNTSYLSLRQTRNNAAPAHDPLLGPPSGQLVSPSPTIQISPGPSTFCLWCLQCGPGKSLCYPHPQEMYLEPYLPHQGLRLGRNEGD